MPKILVMGDTHIWNHRFAGGPLENGINRRCAEILESIAFTVLHHIEKDGIQAVVQLGDFFDGPRPPPPVMDAAIRMIRQTGVEWHIIAGNHDIASYDAPSAIAPLGHVPNVHVYEEICVADILGTPWLMVPYIGPLSSKAIEQAKQLVAQTNVKPVSAAVHYGFAYNAMSSRDDIIQPTNWPHKVLGYGFFGHEHGSDVATLGGSSLGSFTKATFHDANSQPFVCITDTHVVLPYYQTCAPQFFAMGLVPNMLHKLLQAGAVHMPSYLYIREEQVEEADRLVTMGLCRGYKVAPPEGSTELLNEAMAAAVTPLDAVYEVAGSLVSADLLEDAVAIVEASLKGAA